MADKEKKKEKKIAGFKEFDSAKYIELEPTIDEARSLKGGAGRGTAVVAWGRMNPITIGHEKLVNKVISVASDNKAVPHIFLSHSQDAKKNPLSYEDKIKFGQQAFGRIITHSNAKTIIELMKVLDKHYKNVILVAGSDRIKEFETLLNKYNGKEYKFADIKVVSAGERDPDGDSVSGMSASKMRQYAADDDIVKFVAGLPKKLKKSGDKVMAAVRKGMNMSEENDLEMDEALNRVQRFKKARAMRKARAKIKRGQERAKRKKADMKKIKKRAQKAARNMIKDRLAKPKKYAALSYAEKERIDKRMEKISPTRIERLARKMIPMVKKKEQERLAAARGGKKEEVSLDERFEMFVEKMTKPQDPDVAKRPGSQPKGYYKGVDKNKKDARAAHFEKGAKMSDDNPAAYKPAPGDKEAKTKESKFTKKARAMGFIEDLIWEELVEGLDEGLWGKRVMKRPHMLYSANGKVKFDKRFKMYRSKDVQEANEFDVENIADLYEATETFAEEWVCGQCNSEPCVCEGDGLQEDAAGKSLADKAKKSGMPKGILRQVYNRGVAAWRTGHRPGTTPEQWGHARVNSFITKSSGTWGKADKDLAAKVRKEETQLDELSPRTKASYLKKASAQNKKVQKAYDKSVKSSPDAFFGDDSPKDQERMKTMTKRQKGIAMAKGRKYGQAYESLDEAATPQMKKAAASIEAYAKKHGGIDKADFMKAAKMLSSGNAGIKFVKFVDDLDTEPREWLITNLAKTMGKQTVEKMFKVKIREEVELDEVRRGASTMNRLKDIQNKSNAMAAKPKNTKAERERRLAQNMKKLKDMRKADKSWGASDAFDWHEEVELDEVLDTPKAMDSYRNKAKASKDKATNSAVAKILRKGDHSSDLKTRAKREKGLKMADRNATNKTAKALRGESNLDEQAALFLEKYRPATPEEIKKDKERERKASGKQRPSMNAKSVTKKTYGGMMGGLKAGYGYGEEKSSKKHINTKPTIDEDEKENLAKAAAEAAAKKKAAGEMDEYTDMPKPKRKVRAESSCGAGEQGTDKLTKRYKKDTPMESIPPEIVGAALAAPMVAQGAKAVAKGAYKTAKKIMMKKKAKK